MEGGTTLGRRGCSRARFSPEFEFDTAVSWEGNRFRDAEEVFPVRCSCPVGVRGQAERFGVGGVPRP